MIATFAGGCFWCLQPTFDNTKGIIKTCVGYMGGSSNDANYTQVCTKKTNHKEVIQITFDPQVITYKNLLKIFLQNIDPTDENGQFFDKGPQYQTAIFIHSTEQERETHELFRNIEESNKIDNPIQTTILPASTFYPAEDEHQKYYQKKPFHYKIYEQASNRKEQLKKIWRKPL